MDDELTLKKLERDILESDISIILMKLVKETSDNIFTGKGCPEVEKYSKKILYHIREHKVK